MFRKVLVANRGEIAVRVMRACQELDVATVAIYSEADAHAGHVRCADESYNVGPTAPAESYLDGDAILEIAERAEVDAIHPGYGFLAENADFARRVEESAITWIGPPSDAMEALGEKTRARQVMQDAGVPVIPGTTDPVDSPEEVRGLGDDYGYPIVIKAEGGGGGRGIKVVHEPDEVDEAFESARREGDAYFDNPSVYVEKYLPERHIEVQILADEHGNVRHLGERDCSLQRRNQKLIEEAPSPALDPEMREAMGEAARRGVEAAGYTNAGTVEFLVDGEDFYFMEVNARIQVEHTVTEEITGLDIVKWQLRVAAGEEIGFEQGEVRFDGHAIEYRINAENPAEGFVPAPGGRFETYDPPGGIGVRVDDAVRQGDDLVTDYDSMFAKLIVRAGDREECLARSARALREFDIETFHTTIPFHRLMVDDEAFVDGTHTTDYLDEELAQERLATAVERWGPGGEIGTAGKDARGARTFTVEVNGKRFDVAIEADDDTAPAERPDNPEPAVSQRASAPAGTGDEEIVAEMEGSILSVAVDEGDEVAQGDVLCVLEAMKMENDIVATANGTVATVAVAEGDRVTLGDVLVVIE